MKKFLRFSLVALFAVLGMSNAMAQEVDVIWEEDFSSYSKDDVPSDGDYSYVCTGGGTKIYNEKLAGGDAPELLVGKSGGTFTATIDLGTRSGEVSLSFKCNKNITVSVSGGTLGTNTGTGNDYVYPITISAESTKLTIEFKNTLSQNARLDNIKLYQGNAKKPAGIAWNKSAASVTYGNPDDTYKYLPTFSNPNELDVTFESSNTEVISLSTEGEITVNGPGESTLTASFAGNDEYEEATVTCKVTVNKPQADIKNTPETPYTVSEVLDILSEMDNNNKSVEVYTKGTVKSVTEVSVANGNATFVITDGTKDIDVFRVKYLEKENFTANDQIKVDDEVIIYGQLVNYLSSSAEPGTAPTPEIAQGGYIYSLNGETESHAANPEDAITKGKTADSPMTVDEALAYINAFPNAGFTTTNQYYVTGAVSSDPEINTTNGNATFQMSGTNGTLTVFRVKGLEDKKITAENYLENGDDVIICAKLQKYVKNSEVTPELSSGYIYSLNGETEEQVDPYTFVGDGTETNPYTVEDVLHMAVPSNTSAADGQERVWVKGIIAGAINSNNHNAIETTTEINNNLALAATAGETVFNNTVPVQLSTNALKDELGIANNPSHVSKELVVYGFIVRYFNVTGVKGVTDYILDGVPSNISALTIDTDANAPMYNLKGERVDANYRGVVIKGGKKTIQK